MFSLSESVINVFFLLLGIASATLVALMVTRWKAESEIENRNNESLEKEGSFEVFKMINDAILIMEKKGWQWIPIKANEKAFSLLNPNIGQKLDETFPTRLSHDLMLTSMEEVLALGKDSLFEFEKDGVPILARVKPLKLKNKQDCCAVFFTDDSRLKDFEKQLFEQLQFEHDLISNAPSPLAVRDKDGRYISVNKAWNELFESESEIWIDRDWDVIRNHFPTNVSAFIRNPSPLGSGEIDEEECSIKLPSGKNLEVIHARSAFGNDFGAASFYVESIADVTFSKEAEKRMLVAIRTAEENSRLKSDFLANMSHEIRTPMNSIIGMTKLALEGTLSTQQREFLDITITSAEALLSIINDILDFSKIEAGKLNMEHLSFDPRKVIAEACKTLYPKFNLKGVDFHLDMSSDIPDILIGDPGRIRQLLINLLSNAYKFTDKGLVKVTVRAESEHEKCRLRVSVEDTGCGIPSDKLHIIFDAFAQADSSTTRRYGGTGLGLAISQNLVTLMGGEIKVSSKENVGSIFNFSILLPFGAQVKNLAPSVSDKIIAIIEPNVFERRSLESILKSWGIEVLSFDDHVDLVDDHQVKEKVDSVIINSSLLKSGDGKFLKEIFPKASFVVSMSGVDGKDAFREADFLGGVSILRPVSPSELHEALFPSRDTEGEEKEIETTSLAGLKVLVAEDNQVNRRLVLTLLDKFKCESTAVFNGKEALDLIVKDHDRFDVVLMDIQMPIMGGIEAVEKIREFEKETKKSQLPVIALTAHAMEQDRNDCLKAGMNAHVTKPIRFEELKGTLDWIFRNKCRVEEKKMKSNMDLPAWNPNDALTISMDDEALMTQIIELFAADIEEQAQEILNALENDDKSNFMIATHTVKGAILTVGYQSLADVAASMEKMAREEGLVNLQTLSTDFVEKVKEFKQTCLSWLARDSV